MASQMISIKMLVKNLVIKEVLLAEVAPGVG